MYVLSRSRQLFGLLLIGLSRDSSYRKQIRLVEALIELGGVYIKFAQLMLVRMNDLRGMSQQDYSFLLKQTYDATPLEAIDAGAIVRAELGSQAAALTSISERPIASGSFGQVYSARLTDTDQSVIIKIIKPNVLATIKYDLRILGVLTRLIDASGSRAVSVTELFAEMRHVIMRELDYKAEVYNANKLYEAYQDHSNLVIPRTYEHLSTKHIIVQEYIEGLALTEVLDQKNRGTTPVDFVKQQTGSNLIYQMTVIGQEMLAAMLRGGVTHGDPHPGNILLLSGNQVALIDFGICTEGPGNKQAFFNIVKQYRDVYVHDKFDIEAFTLAVIDLFGNELMGAVRSLDQYHAGQLSPRVIAAIQAGVRAMFEGAGRDIDILVQDHKFMQIFDSVVNENNRFGLSITIDQPAFIRATLLYISLVKSLDIKEDVLKITYGNVCDAFQNYTFATYSTPNTPPEQAVALIAEWLEQVASRDIFLYRILTNRIGRGVLYV